MATSDLLWPSEIVFAEGVPPPTLTRYDPPPGTANVAAIVVCPGGGYQMLADHEGAPVAEWLTTHLASQRLSWEMGKDTAFGRQHKILDYA